MTKPYSQPGDNGGRCESCNHPETTHVGQTSYPIKMADGSGGWEWGTMWLCPDCLKTHQERDSVAKCGPRTHGVEMDETKLSILEKTGSSDVQELVAEVRALRQTVAEQLDTMKLMASINMQHLARIERLRAGMPG